MPQTELDHWPCGLLSLDNAGVIRTANAWFASRIRIPAAELIGQHIGLLLPPAGRIYLETHFFPILRAEGRCAEVAVDLRVADGTRLPVLLTAQRAGPGDGRSDWSMVAVMEARDRRRYERDLLETKRQIEERNRQLDAANAELAARNAALDRAAAEMAAARAEAEAANSSKSLFLANMSHEIRTPLNGVLGMAEVLEAQLNDPRKKAMAHVIRQSGELLLRVINDILDMSKIEAGKMEIEAAPFTPAEAIRNIEDLHRLRAEEKGLGFEVFIGAGADRPRLGDPLRLQQIVGNIVGNAIKFTERGSVALLVSARPGQPLEIEVRDTGIGMTEAQQARLFRAFEQAEAGTARRFGGTGLGMAIVRSLVDMMGGAITVQSAPGSGTAVKISLPLPETQPVSAADAPRPAPAEATPSAPRSTLPLAGARLLVADDSEVNRMVLEAMLAGTGAELIMACDGGEALALWNRLLEQDAPPDALLLDISMPVMDGTELLARIRGSDMRGMAVAAIAITANAMPDQVAAYLAAGFQAHVAKPFRRDTLVQTISGLIAGAAVRPATTR